MRLYRMMNRLPWPRSYVAKILLLCFIGTHVPLVALVVWTLSSASVAVSLPILVIVLLATLAGTAFTFAALISILEPVRASAQALEAYTKSRALPNLPTGYSDEAGRLLGSVQATLGQLDRNLDELSRIAMTDSLTTTRNRRWLNEVGIPLFETRHRRGETCSLLVIDLDHFKTVNDTWGHSVGDQVLVIVADALLTLLENGNQAVRTGGDEFCVFLPDVGQAGVAAIAERIRRAVIEATRELPIDGSVTISIGATSALASDRTFTDLYRRADQNLYRAKREGRDGVALDAELSGAPSK